MTSRSALLVALLVMALPAGARAGTVVVGLTGLPHDWTVPAGVQVATFELHGGQGGSSIGGTTTHPGGKGAKVTQTLAVAPGQVFTVVVGGGGGLGAYYGYNGGGLPGGEQGGRGGGASDVRVGAQRVLVAAGGGGGGRGGAGGDSAAAGGGAGGQPGTANAGGAGGTEGSWTMNSGQQGMPGIGGMGGTPWTHYTGCESTEHSGGGGGGSSLVQSGGVVTEGVNVGHGRAVISWTDPSGGGSPGTEPVPAAPTAGTAPVPVTPVRPAPATTAPKPPVVTGASTVSTPVEPAPTGSFTIPKQLVDCSGPGPNCVVGTTTTAVGATGAAARAGKLVVGRSTFTVKAGQQGKVTIKLTREGRKLLARKRRLKATVTITVTRSAVTAKRSVTVTLKAPKARRR